MSNGNGWMPLYIGDYLGDTMELDAAQHGAYLLLLMYYWRNGPLPTDDAKLAQIARTEIRTWRKVVGPVVKAFFREVDGRLHQKRADAEMAKAAECRERAAERRHADNDRLKNWRARQSQDGSHPPERPNGKDPPPGTSETRFTGVSPPVSERVSKRHGNADETRRTITDTAQPPVPEEREESLKKPSLSATSARAERLPDALEAALSEAGVMPPERPNDEKPVGAEVVQMAVRRTAKAMEMRIPYGETRSVEAQLQALEAQPGAVGAEETMGLKWQPAEPVRSVEEQIAAMLADATPDQLARARRRV